MTTPPQPSSAQSDAALTGGWANRKRRNPRNRAATFLILTLAAGGLSLGLLGCATTVTPPRGVADPVTVYLADYGRHSSLMLPRETDALVEYAFGEWRWFALNDTGVRAACRALCWGTTGTLGRRSVAAATPDSLEELLAGVTLFAIRVEREAANALVERLDDRWLRHEADAVYNPEFNLHFVPVAQRYHVFRNCNPVVAGWLRDLDCRVRGPALTSNWRLRPGD
jgi:hypothetical protein